MKIRKSALIVMMEKRSLSNIYKLLGSILVIGIVLVQACNVTAKLWNMHLGHLLEGGMMKLYNRNLFKVFFSILIWTCPNINCTLRKYFCVQINCTLTRDHSIDGFKYFVTFNGDFLV